VDWLGEDLLLLALDAGRGTLERTFALGYGLMGADLVRLAACGRDRHRGRPDRGHQPGADR
jgi:hypothetical protein